ncbi:MAG: hypothetical protein AAGC88_00360, partial [Bacteroidota bacterium]
MKKRETPIIILGLIIALISSIEVSAQAPEWRATQYQAYIKQDIGLWHKSFKQAATNNDPFTIGMAGYGILNASLPLQNEDLFDEYLDDTSDPLDEIID